MKFKLFKLLITFLTNPTSDQHAENLRQLQFWSFCNTTDLDWLALRRPGCCWQSAFGPYIILSSLSHTEWTDQQLWLWLLTQLRLANPANPNLVHASRAYRTHSELRELELVNHLYIVTSWRTIIWIITHFNPPPPQLFCWSEILIVKRSTQPLTVGKETQLI